MWPDSQGRLFGKLNLVDLLGALFLLSMGGVVAYAVGVSRYQALEIGTVEPKRIVAGPGQFVVVRGTGFDPSTTVGLGKHIVRKNVHWEASALGVEINEEIEPGLYALRVRDGHGRTATTPDLVEVVWEPKISQVKPKIIYSTGEGARLDISGTFFFGSCTIRLGEREILAEKHNATPTRLLSADFSKGPPLPLGPHRLTVTNPGGQSVTWEEAVTVAPPPEVTSAAPDWIVLGDVVDLVLHGKHFREGTTLWVLEERIGETTRVSPNCLKIRLKTNPKMKGGAADVFFELRDGPKTRVGERLINVSPSCPVFMVATFLLDEESAHTMPEFRNSLEWKLRPPLLGRARVPGMRKKDKVDSYPIVEVLLPAQIAREGGELVSSALERPLKEGKHIRFKIKGQELSGVLIAKPFAVFSDDYFENKRSE